MRNSLKLAEIQKIMAHAITHSYDKSADLVPHIICEKYPIAIRTRIKIYQDAYQIRLRESISEDFSRVSEKLGPEGFKKIIHDYILTHPSTYVSLAEYSQNFPKFLKNISIELCELAQIDWIEIMAHYVRGMKSENLLTPEEIQSGQNFHLVLNPTLFTVIGEKEITIAYRRADEVHTLSLNPVEWRLLKLININKKSIDFSKAIEDENLDLTLVSSYISNWIKDEIIFCERI